MFMQFPVRRKSTKSCYSQMVNVQSEILIMDDPTRGIDVGAKFEIYKLMNDLAEQGVSIIMTSSDLVEVLGMSDRVMVMHEGRSQGILDISEATQEKLWHWPQALPENLLIRRSSKEKLL